MNFKDKNVVITGGSTGIGLATAKAFVDAGANVLITGKNADNLQKAAAEINNPKLKTLVSDATDLTGIAEIEQAVAANGKLDVLFLNAGIAQFAPLEQTPEAMYDALFNTNVKGLYFTFQKLIPHLKDGASVVVTSSMAGTGSMQNASVYSATKSAVKSIAKVAANELADRKIRVNIVSPGPTDTPNYSKLGFPEEAVGQFKDFYASNTVVKRMGRPDEIAKAVLFLASDDASFITGSDLLIDGGFINYALK